MIEWWVGLGPAKRVLLIAVLTPLGIVALLLFTSAVEGAAESRKPPLPFRSALSDGTSTLRAWDDDVGRGRFIDGGYELLVKERGRTVSGVPNTQRATHQHVEVTVVFRRSDNQTSDSQPSVGLICRSLENGFYDFRLRVDGRFAIYRRNRNEDYRELASSTAMGLPRLATDGAIRLAAECAGFNPTELRFFVNGSAVLTAEDHSAMIDKGDAGFLIGSGADRDFAVLFTDYLLRDLEVRP